MKNSIIEWQGRVIPPLQKRTRGERPAVVMKNFKIKEGTIITSDVFDEEVIDGKRISYVPLWYWLLEKDCEEKSVR